MSLPIIFNWATETNYPSGSNPWSSQPVKVAPSGDVFTPNTKPGAQNFNYALNKLAGVDAAILAWLGGIQFRPAYSVSSALAMNSTTCVAWDSWNQKWLAAGNLTSSTYVVVATGRGADLWDWHLTGGSSTPFAAIADSICRGIEPSLSPASKYAYVGMHVSGAGYLGVYDTSAGSATLIALAENTNVQDVSVISVSGTIILAVGGSSSAISHLNSTSNQGGTITTWVATSSYVTGWLLAQSVPGGGTVMAIPAMPNGSGKGLASLDVYTTTNGTSWTYTNVTTSGMGPTEVPTALAWGADATGAGCWILQTFVSGTYNTYRSYDGVTWAAIFTSNISTLVSGAIQGMAAIGSAFVAIVNETPNARIIYSVDGAITWQVSASTLVNSGVSTCMLAGGSNGFMAMSHAWLVPSFTYGVSGSLGNV
jgi:hypothetical protein